MIRNRLVHYCVIHRLLNWFKKYIYILPSWSSSQSGQVCWSWIFHGDITHHFKCLHWFQFEGENSRLSDNNCIRWKVWTSKRHKGQTSLSLSLQGEFYNIGKHQEPPFSPTPFSLPPQVNNMLYIGMSAFTTNSAGFVYNNAGALSLYITDDMVRIPSQLQTCLFQTHLQSDTESSSLFSPDRSLQALPFGWTPERLGPSFQRW